MSTRDDEHTEYVAARLSSLRRLAAVLCDDWQRADDLVQATLTRLYVHWGRARQATAEVLGCSPGTVKSQTARALDAVRRTLGPTAYPPGPRSPRATAVSPRSGRECRHD